MKKTILYTAAACLILTGCAGSSAVRMSEREMLVQSSAAPVCGGEGAAKVAQKQAAIETIKAGYDRYMIVGAQSANNIQTHVMPTSSTTYGNATLYGNRATYNATTSYNSTVMTTGRHQQQFVIRMFKDADQGASDAISARSILGPKWQEVIKGGVYTCT